MRLIIEQINDQQKKAFMVVAKAMNVKVEKEVSENQVITGFRNALKTMKQVKVEARPIEDILNEL
jgi:hypothetical protein